jgi:hypothetical protein
MEVLMIEYVIGSPELRGFNLKPLEGFDNGRRTMAPLD